MEYWALSVVYVVTLYSLSRRADFLFTHIDMVGSELSLCPIKSRLINAY